MRPEDPTGNYLPANAFQPFDRFPLVSGDAIRALSHPYRESILKVLEEGRTTYSDLFIHLEPNGDDRGRFNYHLRSLRNADLIRRADSLYYLTPRGEAALVLLKGVSQSTGSRFRTKQDSRAGERGWVRRVGDALRLRTAGVKAVVALGRVAMTWKIRSPTSLVLGIAALEGVILIYFIFQIFLGWNDGIALVVAALTPATWTSPYVWVPLTMILGVVLFFGGFALFANGIQGIQREITWNGE